MSFFDILDEVLSALEIPYYEGQPEFAEGDVPDEFVSYSVYDIPKLYGCGRELATTYYVTVNIYTSGEDKAQTADNISAVLTTLLTEKGFVRRSGSFGLTDDFPSCYHRIVEFGYCEE